MTRKRIGQLIFLKYCGLTVVFVSVVVIAFASVKNEPFAHFVLRVFDGLKENFIFIFIQVFCVILSAQFLGSAVAGQVIEKRRNTFVVGALGYVVLWIVLFWSSALTAAAIDAFTMEKFYFTITFDRWLMYYSVSFLVLGVIHGLSLGFLTAREIRRKGDALSG